MYDDELGISEPIPSYCDEVICDEYNLITYLGDIAEAQLVEKGFLYPSQALALALKETKNPHVYSGLKEILLCRFKTPRTTEAHFLPIVIDQIVRSDDDEA
jgi:hypothetical protein